nr:transposase [Streptomyces sp. QHH-9511]
MRTLVDLAPAPEYRRGHGALYSGLNQGRIDVARLRRALVGMPQPLTSPPWTESASVQVMTGAAGRRCLR